MADVAAALKDWSATASSNLPADATTIGAGLADNFQQLQATVRTDLASKGADIASATTTDLGAVPGHQHDITGNTTITGFGTVAAGIWKIIKFEGALTLTHNATSLILPGAANITTADGDVAIMVSEGSGNWRCITYSGKNLSASGGNFSGTVAVGAAVTAQRVIVNGSSIPANGIYLPAANTLGFATNGVRAGGFDSSQNFEVVGTCGVGAAPSGLIQHYVTASGTKIGFYVDCSGGVMLYSGTASQTFLSGESGADAALRVRKDGTSNRSINAAGTINASGADIAEYHKKSPTCGNVRPGQIVGRNAHGFLVDKWSECV